MRKPTKDQLQPETISRRGRFELTAQVTPRFGANLVSFRVDGAELLWWHPKRLLAGGECSGAFNMWPTPCRLANCSYRFGGRKIVQRKRGEKIFIHGVVRDEEFAWRNDGDRITSWIEIQPGHPTYDAFPFHCVLRVTHELHAAGLFVRFAVENKDKRALPFGYGIHPFWRFHGTRKQTQVRIPCEHILELKDLIPTGKYRPVAGTPLDLRTRRDLDGLYIDNVFWKRRPGATAEVVFGAIGKRLTISASKSFAHLIVYAPPRKRFVCVENLTASPNAQNLAAAGHRVVAGLTVVAPGRTATGWIKYTIANG